MDRLPAPGANLEVAFSTSSASGVLLQAMARDKIASLADARAIIAVLFEVETYEPRDVAA